MKIFPKSKKKKLWQLIKVQILSYLSEKKIYIYFSYSINCINNSKEGCRNKILFLNYMYITATNFSISLKKHKHTLLRFPNPILCTADDFHSGKEGLNWTQLRPLPLMHSLSTPSGRVQRTASAFSVC